MYVPQITHRKKMIDQIYTSEGISV